MIHGVAMAAKEVTESPEKPTFTVSVVQPVPNGRPTKGGWANLPKMCVCVDCCVGIKRCYVRTSLQVCINWD